MFKVKKSTIESHDGEIFELFKKVGDLEYNMDHAQKDIFQIDLQLSDYDPLNGEVIELDKRVSQLEKENEDYENRIWKLENLIDDLQCQINNIKEPLL